MTAEHEIENLEHEMQRTFDRYDLVGKRFAPGEFDVRIAEEAPQASSISVRANVKSLRNEHKTNIATIVGVVSKPNGDCKEMRLDYGNIQLSDTHFKPEGDFCYYHYYGECKDLNRITTELKMVMRDLVREHRRRI